MKQNVWADKKTSCSVKNEHKNMTKLCCSASLEIHTTTTKITRKNTKLATHT